jgi:hypothetical protein
VKTVCAALRCCCCGRKEAKKLRKSIEGTICGNKLIIELKLEDGAGFKIFKNIRI